MPKQINFNDHYKDYLNCSSLEQVHQLFQKIYNEALDRDTDEIKAYIDFFVKLAKAFAKPEDANEFKNLPREVDKYDLCMVAANACDFALKLNPYNQVLFYLMDKVFTVDSIKIVDFTFKYKPIEKLSEEVQSYYLNKASIFLVTNNDKKIEARILKILKSSNDKNDKFQKNHDAAIANFLLLIRNTYLDLNFLKFLDKEQVPFTTCLKNLYIDNQKHKAFICLRRFIDSNKNNFSILENDQITFILSHLVLAECYKNGWGVTSDLSAAITILSDAFNFAIKANQSNVLSKEITDFIFIYCSDQLEKISKEKNQSLEIQMLANIGNLQFWTKGATVARDPNLKVIFFQNALTYFEFIKNNIQKFNENNNNIYPELNSITNNKNNNAEKNNENAISKITDLANEFNNYFCYSYGVFLQTQKKYKISKLYLEQCYTVEAALVLANGYCQGFYIGKSEYKNAIEIYKGVLNKTTDRNIIEKILAELESIHRCTPDYTEVDYKKDLKTYCQWLVENAKIEELLRYLENNDLLDNQYDFAVVEATATIKPKIKLDFSGFFEDIFNKINFLAQNGERTDIFSKAASILREKAENCNDQALIRDYQIKCFQCCEMVLNYQRTKPTINELPALVESLVNLIYLSHAEQEANEKIIKIFKILQDYQFTSEPIESKIKVLKLITSTLQIYRPPSVTVKNLLEQLNNKIVADLTSVIIQLNSNEFNKNDLKKLNELNDCINLLLDKEKENIQLKQLSSITLSFLMQIYYKEMKEMPSDQRQKSILNKLAQGNDRLEKIFALIYLYKFERQEKTSILNTLSNILKSPNEHEKNLTTWANEGIEEAMLELAEHYLTTRKKHEFDVKACMLLFMASLKKTYLTNYSDIAKQKLELLSTTHNNSETQAVAQIFLSILNNTKSPEGKLSKILLIALKEFIPLLETLPWLPKETKITIFQKLSALFTDSNSNDTLCRVVQSLVNARLDKLNAFPFRPAVRPVDIDVESPSQQTNIIKNLTKVPSAPPVDNTSRSRTPSIDEKNPPKWITETNSASNTDDNNALNSETPLINPILQKENKDNEIEELKKRLKESEEKNQRLTKENEKIHEEKNKLAEINEILAAKSNDLINENETLTAEKIKLEEENKAQNTKINELTNANKKLTAEKNVLDSKQSVQPLSLTNPNQAEGRYVTREEFTESLKKMEDMEQRMKEMQNMIKTQHSMLDMQLKMLEMQHQMNQKLSTNDGQNKASNSQSTFFQK